jgi:hypothetical protein
MVATLIMGIAVVGVMSAISGSLRGASRLMERDRAAQLAAARMNDLLADYRAPRGVVLTGGFDPLLTGGLPAGWRGRIVVLEKHPSAVVGSPAIDHIELEVWWMSGRQRRTFTLDGYRTRNLTAQDLPSQAAPPGAGQ